MCWEKRVLPWHFTLTPVFEMLSNQEFTELTMSKLYTMEMNSITGESVSLSEYRDQVLLIVNLASQ